MVDLEKVSAQDSTEGGDYKLETSTGTTEVGRWVGWGLDRFSVSEWVVPER